MVVVGDLIFTEHTDPTHFQCPYETSYYDPELGDTVHYHFHTCRHTVILEVDFNGSTYNWDKYVSTSKLSTPAHLEYIDEVIETRNYIAFVGYFTNHRTTIVHRCDKGGVVNSFGTLLIPKPHWCYRGGETRGVLIITDA